MTIYQFFVLFKLYIYMYLHIMHFWIFKPHMNISCITFLNMIQCIYIYILYIYSNLLFKMISFTYFCINIFIYIWIYFNTSWDVLIFKWFISDWFFRSRLWTCKMPLNLRWDLLYLNIYDNMFYVFLYTKGISKYSKMIWISLVLYFRI